MLPGMGDMSYEDRLRKIDLPTLAYKHKRARGDMIEAYKILHDKHDQEVAPKLRRSEGITKSHGLKLFKN